jgi:hypothetical protein
LPHISSEVSIGLKLATPKSCISLQRKEHRLQKNGYLPLSARYFDALEAWIKYLSIKQVFKMKNV